MEFGHREGVFITPIGAASMAFMYLGQGLEASYSRQNLHWKLVSSMGFFLVSVCLLRVTLVF